ncbi:hypothetical protein HZA97_04705 [Candidatus Woesearchaeota archaeon]|nr:hypothetical protein [Candidatus Woesearchaeota archaeon]
MGLDEKITKEDAQKFFKEAGITKGDQAIIKELLKYGLRNPDRWGTKKGLSIKINPQDPEHGLKTVEKLLAGLEPKLTKLGVELRKTHSNIHDEEVYSIIPESKKGILKFLPIFDEQKKKTTVLFIADPGYGQNIHDPRSDKGAHYFLKYNKLLEEIDTTIVIGAVPRVPARDSPLTTQYMKLLGKKVQDTQFPDEDDGESDEDEDNDDFSKKHVKSKITSLPEAIESGAKSLEDLLGENYQGDLHLVFGYQDHLNLYDKEKLLKTNYRDLMKDKDKQEDKINKLELDHQEQDAKYKALEQSVEFFKELKNYLKREKEEEVLAACIAKYAEEQSDSLKQILSESVEIHQEVSETLERLHEKQEVLTHLTRLTEKRDEQKMKTEVLKHKLQEEMHKKSEIEKTLKNYSLHAFHGDMSGDPQKTLLHHRQAMKEYTEEVSQLWKDWNGGTDNIHPEGIVDLEVNGYIYRIEPQVSKISKSPGLRTLQKQMQKIRENPSTNKIIPDVYASAHDAGGTRAMPQPKRREEIEEGKYSSAGENVLHLKLPTMHSEDMLDYWRINNVNGPWEINRYDKLNYASGIVLQIFDEEGLTKEVFIDNKDLVEAGLRAEKLESLKKEIKDNLSNEQKKTLQKQIEELENSFKIEPEREGKLEKTIDIAHIGDSHTGSPSFLGRTTNLELVEAVVKYSNTRNSEVIVLSELLHGNHDAGSFRSDKQDVGLLPHEIQKITDIIRNDAQLNDQQKIAVLSYFSFLNRLTQPMSSSSKQLLEVADSGLIQYAEKILEENGIAILVSGNHYNHSNGQSHDEAEVLSLCFDRKYRDSGRIWVLDGTGERDGRGQASLNQLRTEYAKKQGIDYGNIYAAHSFKVAGDPIFGIMQNTQLMQLPARAIFGSHVHQTGFGYSSGKSIHIQPGLQTTNKFVDVIGQAGGFRGAMNVELSRNEYLPSYRKVTWAPQKYLEDKFLKEQTWAHQQIVEKYIPQARGKK